MGWKEPSEKKAVSLEVTMKPSLMAAFKHRKWIMILSLFIFLFAAAYSAFLPISLLPSAKTGQVAIKLELPQGSTLDQVDKGVQKVENNLKKNSKIKSFSSTFGSTNTPQGDDVFDQGGGFLQKPNVANLSVVLNNDQDADSVLKQLSTTLPNLSNKVAYTVTSQNISGDDSK